MQRIKRDIIYFYRSARTRIVMSSSGLQIEPHESGIASGWYNIIIVRTELFFVDPCTRGRCGVRNVL